MLERERVFYAARNRRLLHQQIHQHEIDVNSRQQEQQPPVPPTNTGCITVQRRPFDVSESDEELDPSAVAVVDQPGFSAAAVAVIDKTGFSSAAAVTTVHVVPSAVYSVEDRAELLVSFPAVCCWWWLPTGDDDEKWKVQFGLTMIRSSFFEYLQIWLGIFQLDNF